MSKKKCKLCGGDPCTSSGATYTPEHECSSDEVFCEECYDTACDECDAVCSCEL